jgi:hypothetical protein
VSIEDRSLLALLSKFERTSRMPLVSRSNLVAGEFQNIAYRFSTFVLGLVEQLHCGRRVLFYVDR